MFTRTSTIAALTAGLAMTALAGSAQAAESDIPTDVAALIAQGSAEAQGKAPSRLSDAVSAAAASKNTRSSDKTAGDWWVNDTIIDGYDEPTMWPELLASGLSVSKEHPEAMVLVGVTDEATYSTDQFGFMVDVTGDGAPDFGAATGGPMVEGVLYSGSLQRINGGVATTTGDTVVFARYADGYAVQVSDWRKHGMTRVSYTTFLSDGAATDAAPDYFAPAVPVGELVKDQVAPAPVTTAPAPPNPVPPTQPTQPAPTQPAPSPTATAQALRTPAKVTGLSVSASRKAATARWKPVAGATTYQVMVVGSTSHKTWKAVKKPTTAIAGLKPGKRYTVKIKAGNAAGQSAIITKTFRTQK